MNSLKTIELTEKINEQDARKQKQAAKDVKQKESRVNKKITCNQCTTEMSSIIFSIGKNITLHGYTCEDCGMNYVNPAFSDKAFELLQLYINVK
jgi:transcription elongation factor Elf1